MRALPAFVAAAFVAAVSAQSPARPASMAPLSPADELRTFHLPDGYRLELVASEPMVIEPAMCVFGADGAMYVAELRTYVQDADGTGTNDPKSRIVRLTDTDGDGRMDHATTFVDGLVLPRMVLPLDDRILVRETYDGILWSYRDTDGDGVADQKDKVFENGRSDANLEHQDSALTWAIDNWVYSAMGAKRLRFGAGGAFAAEDVPHEFAQWGLAFDDLGRAFFASAGGERAAYGFQQHAQYGQLDLPDQFEKGFEEPFPLVALPDVQGGTGRLKPDGTLNHFTGCCGQSIYRGDALPAELRGDYFLCEPVGRLVRRAQVDVVQGVRVLRNRHPGSEFLRSTDPNFRPIWSANGPDGCFYFVDMYRGIIQESNWVREGSYLRPQVLELGLDQNIGRGRIWRLVHDGQQPVRAPDLLRLGSGELVPQLAHANGWVRDTAQRLLVLRGDAAALPALHEMAASHPLSLARVHALWTLDGLGQTTQKAILAAFADPDPRVRETAVRVGETLLRAGDAELLPHLRKLTMDPSVDVRVQVLRSLRYLPGDAARDFAIDLLAANGKSELFRRVGKTTLEHGKDPGAGAVAGLEPRELQRWRNGREIFRTTCITCHGPDGLGMPSGELRLAAPLRGSRWLLQSDEVAIRILLHGLTGALDGVEYPGNLMAPQGGNTDAFVADVLTYVRNAFGNAGTPIATDAVARVREAHRQRTRPWTPADLEPLLPVAPARMQEWQLRASHGGNDCGHAIDGDAGTRWSTGTPMRPGMWFQIGFVAPFAVQTLVLDTRGSKGDYPRGFELRISDDGEQWSEPLVAGEGDGPITKIAVPLPRAAKFVRVTQTGSVDGLYWSIHELQVLGH